MAVDQDIDALGVFAEPQRRRVYEQVQAEGPCTVAELVDELGMGRTLVAFHLGKLIESGFVEMVAPERGSASPGRPAQRYRITELEVVASVPDRRYDLLAGILLDSMAEFRAGETAQGSALRAARRHGSALGHQLRGRSTGRSAGSRLGRLERLLSALGYSPRREGAEISVRNCPFDKFRATNTEQVCLLNQALCEGYLDGLELGGHLQARLRPSRETCCVVFAPKNS